MRANALFLLLSLAGAAGAQTQSPPSTAPTAPTTPPSSTAPTAPTAAPRAATTPEETELLPPEKPPDAATLARQKEINDQIRRRRSMLQMHQAAGFATLTSLALAVTLGQLNYLDKYAGGGDSGRWIVPHRVASYSAAGIFAGTALLAVLAPNPTEKPLRLDTATLHKAAMGIATLGYASEIVLGILAARSEGAQTQAARLRQRDYALAHQIIGYTTFAAAAGGFLVLTF
jgi:hypothetical protein